MFFENSDDQEGEVRISTSEEREQRKKEEESKLKKEAESKLKSSSSSKSSSRSSSSSLTSTGSDISIEDVHRQNERIIELLEDLNDDSPSSKDKSQELGGGAAADGLL